MAEEAPLHTLIGRLYEAALDDDLWRKFLLELAALLHAEMPGMHPCITKSWDESVPPDGMVDLDELAPVPIERWEFYADWMRPQGQRYYLGQFLMRPDGVGTGFGVYREPRAGPFEREDAEILRTLAPHLARALALRDRFAVVRAERDVASTALDRLSVGLLLFDDTGELLAANSVAEQIASARDGLRLEATRLSLGDRRADRELRRLLAEAVRVARGESVGGGGAMRVPRPSGRRPYELLVTPLPREGLRVASRRAAVALFLSAPDAPAPASGQALRELYGLTPAEARLAVRLSRGDRLEDAADALRVAIGTARNELKQVFEKTGTHRQAELVHLLESGVARLAPRSASVSESKPPWFEAERTAMASVRSEDVHQLVNLVYESALHEERWPDFLSHLTRILRAEIPGITAASRKDETTEVEVLASFGTDLGFVEMMIEHYGAMVLRSVIAERAVGRAVDLDEASPDRATTTSVPQQKYSTRVLR